ncbi:FAS1-like dehydratase domain-containing protein [Faunimonas sp. B44]|uniref:FAS1-like dehydratase domain-containing protein n=1 Tax=Faunimonas sp. B44 TaxID=3461493 RepID=UPI0040450C8D
MAPSGETEIDIARRRDWIGREERVEEVIGATPVRMLAATLDHDDPPPRPGSPIPPLAHWLYTIPVHRHSELAADGHVRRGVFMPDVPLPRRMFAGARVRFLRPLRVGERATRIGRVADIQLKEGRTGTLVFAAIRQEIWGEEGLALVEDQDIVYRGHPAGGAESDGSGADAREPAQRERRYLPDEAMLFRYSALIFNAHRIHYDRRYAVETEGYPGLVVHGQLVATCLADLAVREWGRPLAAFSFRARRPLFDGSPFRVCGGEEGEQLRLWALDSAGRVTMEAAAAFAS